MSVMASGDFRTTRTYETFSFLPPLTQDEIYDQIVYIINQGWTVGLEHDTPENGAENYWGMWKLPFFGMRNPDQVLAELEECKRAYPDHLIRMVGYDNYAQCKGHEFVVYRPRGL